MVFCTVIMGDKTRKDVRTVVSLCGVTSCKHSWDFVCVCVCVYGVVFNWYLIRMSVRSGVLGVNVLMHVLCLLDERCVV